MITLKYSTIKRAYEWLMRVEGEILVQLSLLRLKLLEELLGEPRRGDPSSTFPDWVAGAEIAAVGADAGVDEDVMKSEDEEVDNEGTCTRDGCSAIVETRPTRKQRQVVWSILPGNST